jgi:hypothetical protein
MKNIVKIFASIAALICLLIIASAVYDNYLWKPVPVIKADTVGEPFDDSLQQKAGEIRDSSGRVIPTNRVKIAVQFATDEGKPIDSNPVIPPTPGTRNVFLFDGRNWEKCEYGSYKMGDSAKYLLYVFEFVYYGIKGQEIYSVHRIGYPGDKLMGLRFYLWDDTMFNCGPSYDEGENTLEGFGVDMSNAGELHGGSLRILKERIESFITGKTKA